MSIPFERLEGKYEIVEKLREGGMGAVYKVRHRLLDEIRVIKVMRPQIADDDVLKERFLREAKMAVRLRHDNLAQIFDFTIDEKGTSFIVMEFIDGVNLADLLKILGRPSLGLVLEVATQSLDVLGYLHRRGVVHRDISPDNLLLTRDEEGAPRIKVIDLGIAKTQEAGAGLTRTGTFIGKLRYCSPEHFQTQSGAKIDGRSDLYSFGIVLYELATSAHPIRGTSTSALISGHLVQPPVAFADSDPEGIVPEDLRRILLRSLEKKADDRYQSAEDFATEVAEVQERYPIDPDEVDRLFSVPVLKPSAAAKPGSTQGKLDQNFQLSATPPPVSVVAAEPVTTPTPPPVSVVQTAAETAPTPPPPAAPPPPPSPYQTAGREEAAADLTGFGGSKTRQKFKALILGAEKLAESGHYEEARLQLATALELDPDSLDAHRLMATIDAADRRRAGRILEAAEQVREQLEAGAVEEAERQLEAAIGRLGGTVALTSLKEDIAEAREALEHRAQRISERLTTARSLMEEQSFEDAMEAIQQALEEDPGNAEVKALLAEARGTLEAQQAARRREEEVATACAAVSAHLDRRSVADAERALSIARNLYSDHPSVAALTSRLEEVRAEVARERREAARDEAAALIEEGRFEEAINRLETLAREAPDEARTGELIQSAREGLQRREEEARRAEAVKETVRGIDNLIVAGRFETAYRTIDTTITELGEVKEILSLRARIEKEVAERRKREAKAWALLGRARSLAEKGDFPAAEKSLEEARAFEADYPEVHELLEETERSVRALAEEHKKNQVLTEAVTSIQRTIERGARDQARREIEVAERLCGPQEALDQLRRRIEELEVAERHAKVEALLREALGKQASFHEVIAKLEEALRLEPDNARVHRLLAETQSALMRYDQEQRAAAIAEVMVEVDGLILEGKFEEALKKVDRATKKLGEFLEARALRHRLHQAIAKRG